MVWVRLSHSAPAFHARRKPSLRCRRSTPRSRDHRSASFRGWRCKARWVLSATRHHQRRSHETQFRQLDPDLRDEVEDKPTLGTSTPWGMVLPRPCRLVDFTDNAGTNYCGIHISKYLDPRLEEVHQDADDRNGPDEDSHKVFHNLSDFQVVAGLGEHNAMTRAGIADLGQ
jgi:hypothetical protein